MTAALRLGVLSTANIARGFVDALKDSSDLRVCAVASRSEAAAQVFAARHGIGRSHGSYEALLDDADIDGIYNPLPNSLHATWTERALRAGKHVLCEKPLTTSAAEAQALFDLAQEQGLVLLEAYPYRYQPQTQRLRSLIDEGAIGEVMLVQSSFGFSLAAGPNIRLDPSLGGGALLDVGCYAVSLARWAIGRRPLSVTAHALAGDSGVDLLFMGSICYEGGAVAQIACSMNTATHRRAAVIGSRGSLETDFLNHTSTQRPGHLRLRRTPGWDAPVEDIAYAFGSGFRYEAERFAELVRHPALRSEARALEDCWMSVENMATLDALAASARSGASVPVARLT